MERGGGVEEAYGKRSGMRMGLFKCATSVLKVNLKMVHNNKINTVNVLIVN